VGKTTAAGKLAKFLQKREKSVLLVATDVYRPAAIDQLVKLGSKIGVPVFEMGTDKWGAAAWAALLLDTLLGCRRHARAVFVASMRTLAGGTAGCAGLVLTHLGPALPFPLHCRCALQVTGGDCQGWYRPGS
jgi:hypothetical protein